MFVKDKIDQSVNYITVLFVLLLFFNFCYVQNYHMLQVVFNNHDHDGQMLVNLDVRAQVLECHGSIKLVSEAHTLKVCVYMYLPSCSI